MLLQLNPTIPMVTPKGNGYAIMAIDYSQEHDLLWVVAINDTGEIWTFQNKQVKLQYNITMGRTPKE